MNIFEISKPRVQFQKDIMLYEVIVIQQAS